MNLLELIAKNDPNVKIQVWDGDSKIWSDHVDPKSIFKKKRKSRLKFRGFKPVFFNDILRGLLLRSGMRIVVKDAGKYWQNYAEGKGVFKLQSLGSNNVKVDIGWALNLSVSPDHKKRYIARKNLKNISVPVMKNSGLNLIIEVPPQKGVKLFFVIHRLLDRKVLYEKCRGTGVEVGPGPKPQILPSCHVSVKYVEQAPPEQWYALYGKETKVPVDSKLWEHYVVGNADNIPAEENTLDFIFSSHVIEHLANPLGHLAYWAKLLKSGGSVVAVIPDRSGCKDYVFKPSTYKELKNEYQSGIMEPTLAHYQRWSEFRIPNKSASEIMESGRSIHVHFYTPSSMGEILSSMYKELGYSEFTIKSEHNHKDFFVILEK